MGTQGHSSNSISFHPSRIRDQRVLPSLSENFEYVEGGPYNPPVETVEVKLGDPDSLQQSGSSYGGSEHALPPPPPNRLRSYARRGYKYEDSSTISTSGDHLHRVAESFHEQLDSQLDQLIDSLTEQQMQKIDADTDSGSAVLTVGSKISAKSERYWTAVEDEFQKHSKEVHDETCLSISSKENELYVTTEEGSLSESVRKDGIRDKARDISFVSDEAEVESGVASSKLSVPLHVAKDGSFSKVPEGFAYSTSTATDTAESSTVPQSKGSCQEELQVDDQLIKSEDIYIGKLADLVSEDQIDILIKEINRISDIDSSSLREVRRLKHKEMKKKARAEKRRVQRRVQCDNDTRSINSLPSFNNDKLNSISI